VAAPDPMQCPRCGTSLQYMGAKKFHEGTRWSVFGDLAELFENREHFDVYMCSRCGRVEFFVDGVGEEFRQH
jgi:ribosomal protein S27AE